MLQTQWRKWCLAALLLFSMFFSTIMGPLKEVSADSRSAETRLEPVYLDDSSYVEAREVYVLPTDTGGAMASFTLVIHNRESHEIEFNDYWVRLLTKSGSSYMVQLLPTDKNKNKITAGADENFTFYTHVNSAVKVQDLIIQVYKWDFSKDDLGSTVGEIK